MTAEAHAASAAQTSVAPPKEASKKKWKLPTIKGSVWLFPLMLLATQLFPWMRTPVTRFPETQWEWAAFVGVVIFGFFWCAYEWRKIQNEDLTTADLQKDDFLGTNLMLVLGMIGSVLLYTGELTWCYAAVFVITWVEANQSAVMGLTNASQKNPFNLKK